VAEQWGPKLTSGLWGAVQGAVRGGFNLLGTREAVGRAGIAPDAATLAHLYSRAVGIEDKRLAEAAYRGTVQPDTYLARRPSGKLVGVMPRGFSMSDRWKQIVAVTGIDPLTGTSKVMYVSVMNGRPITRGQAVGDALALIDQCSPDCLEGEVTAEYDSTVRED
jgi:hypothetical protein